MIFKNVNDRSNEMKPKNHLYPFRTYRIISCKKLLQETRLCSFHADCLMPTKTKKARRPRPRSQHLLLH